MSLWGVIFSYSMKQQFLDQIVMCNEKWIVCDNWRWPALRLDQEEVPKHFPKPNLHQKMVMVTVWWSATDLIHYSFLNPCETITSENYALQMKEIHWKLQYLQLVFAGSQHTRPPPWQGHKGENLTGKADQVFRDFKKLPPALTLKMVSAFLMPASMDYSLISVTQAGRPSLISSQIRINLELLINKFPRWWYFMRLFRVKGVF